MDLRAGGRSPMVKNGPDDETNALEGSYLEVLSQQHIGATDAVDLQWVPQGPFEVRIDEFANARGKPATPPSLFTGAEGWNNTAIGFEAGWTAATHRLAGVDIRIAAQSR